MDILGRLFSLLQRQTEALERKLGTFVEQRARGREPALSSPRYWREDAAARPRAVGVTDTGRVFLLCPSPAVWSWTS